MLIAFCVFLWTLSFSHLQHVEWGTVSLVDAEKRLLANALLDFSNERFVLLSESCIPVYNFPIVYKYLINSEYSFVESYDDPSRYGRGRYNRKMLPDIKLFQWRKGSQWFEIHRALAVHVVSDTKYYSVFKKYCRPACYPDEHYIPTYLNMFHGPRNANRTVTWVDWSLGGPHPATYMKVNVTESLIQSIRNNGTECSYNSEMSSICYLFARKFHPSTLESLLNLTSTVMGFWFFIFFSWQRYDTISIVLLYMIGTLAGCFHKVLSGRRCTVDFFFRSLGFLSIKGIAICWSNFENIS